MPSRHQTSMLRQVNVRHDVGQNLHFDWKWKLGWRQYLMSIWRWLNVGFWLHNLKTTKSQRQLTSVFDINLILTLDVEFTLNFGHPTSQPKFNQISTSYDVVCLLCDFWGGDSALKLRAVVASQSDLSLLTLGWSTLSFFLLCLCAFVFRMLG